MTEKHKQQAPEKLKPCPYCGGEAILLRDAVSEYPADGEVFHTTCLDSCSVAPGVYAQATPEDAIRKWNARAESNALCQEHATEFSVFHVGGCLKCWSDSETAFALSSRDKEIREVLEGLVTRRYDNVPCWCDKGRAIPMGLNHSLACLAARSLWERV